MKSSMMALAVAAALAGCSSTGDSSVFASKDTTVEYYRVFDIKTAPGNPAVVKAASEGMTRHVADATQATPALAGDLQEQPGHFKLAEPSNTAPGAAAGRAPSCEGASWTAKAAPHVNGGDNMNMVACLFPYKNGYHLDMYAVFTKKEGGWLEWPRRFTGRLMGTPEKWTDQTMVDVVKSIRDTTGAQVALIEAKPALVDAPWLQMAPNSSPAATPAGSSVANSGSSTGTASTIAVPPPEAATAAPVAPAAPAPAASSAASSNSATAGGTQTTKAADNAGNTSASGNSSSGSPASGSPASGSPANGTPASGDAAKTDTAPAIGTVATGTSPSPTPKQGMK
jgi:hypothetical protein